MKNPSKSMVNGAGPRVGWSKWKVILVSGLANSIGLVFILIINYVQVFVTGSVYYGYWDACKEV